MGRMYFPGEKIRERLPKRESDGDIVGRFGAWLTKRGAEGAYFCSYFLIIAFIIIRLLVWIVNCFQVGFFRGVFSLFGAWFLVIISIYLSIVIAIAVCMIVWALGWLCYNKWTLITSLILASSWYMKLDSPIKVEQWVRCLREAMLVSWQWYKDVL